ncbi:hypothetical protein [Planosporangium thailandense]|uniref:hypothetical protein n=1 Tax=Planosporangium thailandense TaxID=765197 RepID=UPI00197C7593|nr:hypothetical protein [Planosporangium thailandense]
MLVVAVSLLVPLALMVGGRMALAAQNNSDQANPNCTLIVPPQPLSAAGLATPYRLVATNPRQGPCREANANQAAFVQGTVLDPATGKLSVYNPLVVDDRQRPAATPVTPTLPAGAVVGLWFGFNGTNLTLRDTNGSLKAGHCVNGLGTSVFGEYAYCNAPEFFRAANDAIAAGKLVVPPLGTAADGQACPSTRDFSAVDQDQSDNVTATYLVVGNTAAQNTAANRARLGGRGKVQVNASDNLLVDQFIDKALGCTPFTAPDLADNNTMVTSLALNELQAAAGQGAPVALVPPNDPMVLVNNRTSLAKVNLYRAGVDMPPLDQAGNLATTYCQNMIDIQQKRLQADRGLFSRVTSPDPAAANNLFSFLANRLDTSFANLGCRNLLRMNSPVTLIQRNGVVVDALFFGQGRTVTAKPTTGGGTGTSGRGRAGASATASPTRAGAAGAATVAPSTPSGASGMPTGPSRRSTRPTGVPAPSAPAGSPPAGTSASSTPSPAPTRAPVLRPDPNTAGDGTNAKHGTF